MIWSKKLKRTKQREQVLEILSQAAKPLTAADIYQITMDQKETVWLSTVYRILTIFQENGVIIKTGLLDNGQSFYELNRNEHKHYGVCVGCHKVILLINCPIASFQPEFDEIFYATDHKMEFSGYCGNCHKEY